MVKPDVSVIMPVYNGERFLRDALDSVLAQTFTDTEIIAVDDASRDRSLEVLKSYGHRVKVITRNANSGVCEIARSEGVQAACGRYIAFLDQDDKWYPEKLARQIAFMDEHPEFPLSHTYMHVMDEEGRLHGIRHEGAIPASGPCAAALLKHCFTTVSSMVVRRDVAVEVAGAGHWTDLYTDLEYYFRIFHRFPAGFGFLPEVLGAYRKWSSNFSRDDWRRIPEDVLSVQRLYHTGLWRGLVSRRDIRGILHEAFVANSWYWQGQGRPSRGIWHAGQALRFGPASHAAWGALMASTARAGRRLF